MDYSKIKVYGYITFGIFIILFVFMVLLGIWEIIGSDIAFKFGFSFSVMAFGILFIMAVGQKLFPKK